MLRTVRAGKSIAFLLLGVFLLPVFTAAQSGGGDFDTPLDLHLSAAIPEDGFEVLSLEIRTERDFPCANYSFDLRVDSTEKGLIVNIRDIFKPDNCLTRVGPVSYRLDLSAWGNGSHAIEIRAGKDVWKGKLKVKKGYWKLIPTQASKLVEVKTGILRRIPMQMAWGDIRYSDPSMKAEAEKVVAELIEAGAEPVKLKSGDYGRFSIDDQGNAHGLGIGGAQFEYAFVLKFGEDPQKLKPVLKKYAAKHGKGFLISLYFRDGWRYFSWML